MPAITSFLLARISEDEVEAAIALVREASDSRAGGLPDDTTGITYKDLLTAESDGRHARVLAECKAKREIVEAHPSYVAAEGEVCENCHGEEPEVWFASWPCVTIRSLATVYASHPDYDPAWAPKS